MIFKLQIVHASEYCNLSMSQAWTTYGIQLISTLVNWINK